VDEAKLAVDIAVHAFAMVGSVSLDWNTMHMYFVCLESYSMQQLLVGETEFCFEKVATRRKAH
jgi:hypothetical protein